MYEMFGPEKLEELKAGLRIKYPQLTEADLHHTAGREEEMFRMVAYKLRKTNTEMKEILQQGFLFLKK